MFNRRQLVAAIAIGVCVACGALDLNDPKVIAEQLPGTWTETSAAPGSSTILNLRVSGTTISGSGTFAEEVGASGTLTVTGSIETLQAGSPPTVELNFPRSDGVVGHYVGMLQSSRFMEGSISYTSPSLPVADPIPAEFKRI
jgi:hypothetical protein